MDSTTRDKVGDYYKYLSDALHGSPDSEGFSQLSEALRSELICRTAWRGLRRVRYLDGACFDKVRHTPATHYDSIL